MSEKFKLWLNMSDLGRKKGWGGGSPECKQPVARTAKNYS